MMERKKKQSQSAIILRLERRVHLSHLHDAVAKPGAGCGSDPHLGFSPEGPSGHCRKTVTCGNLYASFTSPCWREMTEKLGELRLSFFLLLKKKKRWEFGMKPESRLVAGKVGVKRLLPSRKEIMRSEKIQSRCISIQICLNIEWRALVDSGLCIVRLKKKEGEEKSCCVYQRTAQCPLRKSNKEN